MILKILGVVLILLVVLALVIGFLMTKFTIKPTAPSLKKAEEIEKSKGVWGIYDEMEKEKLDVTSYDGYVLHGELLRRPSKKYVIVTHGWQYNRNGSIKYANIFYKLGYNVYIYDLRYHGENKKTFCSMGKNESRDIIEVKRTLQERFGKDIEIGLHGESLGCASSLLALGLSDEFSFCIADCGFEDLKKLLLDQTRKMFHLPGIMTYIANLWMILLHGINFFAIKPVEAVKKTNTPILFIHGGEDDFIIPDHSRMGFEACQARKRIEIFEGANHAASYFIDSIRYEKIVTEFLE